MVLIKNKPLLAYIPAGTCNDFGNSLGLKKSLDKIIDIILEGETVLVNVNKINIYKKQTEHIWLINLDNGCFGLYNLYIILIFDEEDLKNDR